MSHYSFKNWLIKEGKDIFGFEKEKQTQQNVHVDDSPIVPINSQVLIETMMKLNLGETSPFSDFADQIQWGKTTGATRMVISPLGSFKSIIRRLQTDLEGNETWICKKIIPYKDLLHSNKNFDENFANILFEYVEKAQSKQIESPCKDYGKLENLVLKLAKFSLRKDVLPEIFIYRGIRQIKKDERYLIHFECRGQGVETPNSGRLEQFIIEMNYNKTTGMIRSFGYDVQSPTRQRLWVPQPSEWDEYFSPYQETEEILNCIGAALSTY